ncbi:MAG: hypothetical protein KAV87_04870 [Desulfobacteraceae bacterium]|nr:hypothetical protein [Desulfobacteraceae bacterium]
MLEPVWEIIGGYSVASITMGGYGKRYNAQALFGAIKILHYGINLSHLKKSTFIAKQ